jgi:lipopolysaccharide biosynthesis regulator YciM
MSALILCGVALVLGWAVAREGAQRRRWREAERLSRALFAAAGMRGRKWR